MPRAEDLVVVEVERARSLEVFAEGSSLSQFGDLAVDAAGLEGLGRVVRCAEAGASAGTRVVLMMRRNRRHGGHS